MKTSNYLIALAALTSFTFVSCSDNDFLGNSSGPDVAQQGNGEITFSTGNINMTRAGEITGLDAANKLNRQFIVWGDKHTTAEDNTANYDLSVFQNYVVKYLDNSAYTTESNTHGWEYVGYTPYDAAKVSPALTGGDSNIQSIKYWDYDAAQGYTFHGISALPSDIENNNVTVTKTTAAATGTVYDKGWTVHLTKEASLADLYAADRKPVTKVDGSGSVASVPYPATAEGKYGGYVTLNFRSLVSKVRFAMYETVPGYRINIERFYIAAPTSSDYTTAGSNTNFQIATNNKYAAIGASGVDLTIKYEVDKDGVGNPNPNVNRVIVDPTIAGEGAFKYAVFGTNLNSADRIGETSPTATYDYADKAYTYVLPQEVGDMTLYVTYTLTSLDGSGEKIVVKGATAKVPASYNMWKNNFAYTYIFKISDNTNGSTGTIETDPAGLYPITFDACVMEESSDFQETITTVDEPSITTYANGKIVTENDEYKAGEPVYITVAAGDTPGTDPKTFEKTLTVGAGGNSRLFEVLNLGTESITEETVANYENNYMILKEVTPASVETTVPMSDGNNKTISALKFTPTAKVYAYQYNDGSKVYWKVIKIADGAATTITATPAVTSSPIVLTDGTATITLKDDGKAILGAAPKFTIYDDVLKYKDNGDGTYTVSLKDKGIKAGTNVAETGVTNYAVAYNGGTSANVGVNLPYKFDVGGSEITSSAKLTLNQGQTKTVNLKVGTVAIGEGVISDGSGITVTETSTAGAYEIAAASNAAAGAHTVTIAGQTLYITVTAYNFGAAKYIYTVDKSGASAISETAKYIDLKQNNGTVTPAEIAVGSIITATGLTLDKKGDAADDKGMYKPTSTTGGVYDISYQGAKAQVTINEYNLAVASGSSATFNHETGSTKLTLKLNGKEIIPVIGNFTIVDGASDVTANFTISIVGKNITIAPKSGLVDAKTYTAKYTVNNAESNATVVAKIALIAE